MRSAVLRPIYRLFHEGTLVGSSDAELLEQFVARRDERAFEALVVRHGRSVQAVCLDVLRDAHDAEDAFQATFLILARKAGALWVGDSLAAWLHRVARRVAVEANRQKARRRAVETTGLDIEPAQAVTAATPSWGTLPQALHDEIDRLPEKYRIPIILCDLEALTRDEAARRLGWPPGTVAGRLARARALLRDRLVRRGHAEWSGFAILGQTRFVAHGDALAAWIKTTARLLSSSSVGGLKSSGAATGGSAALGQGVIRAMMWTRLKTIAVAFFAAGVLPAVLALAVAKARLEPAPDEVLLAFQKGPAAQAADRPSTKPAKASATGTVVLLDGAPARGARVFVSVIEHAYGHAQLRAQASADPQGRFSLDFPPVIVATAGWVGTGSLWAYRPGSRVAFLPVYRGALPPGLPQRLVLGPPARAVFEVRGPDGKPVADARIEPRGLNSHYTNVPDELASIIGTSTITDAHGRAIMTAFDPEEIASVLVMSATYGRQDFHLAFQELVAEPRVLTLRPAGRLAGRLVGDPESVRHQPLQVSSFSPPGDADQWSFVRDITTDDEGRFDIPAIDVGPHGVRTIPRSDYPWYAHSEGLVDVKPGQTTEVVLTLKRATRVRGFVREKGTGKPIEGVRVGVTVAETAPMTTDPNGHYEGYVPPEITNLSPWWVPPGYAMPIYALRQQRIPEGAVDVEMPTLELAGAGELVGLVVDDRARPVAGAEVVAYWILEETGPGTRQHRLTARTGPDGRFVVDRVPVEAEVKLTAHHGGVRTDGPRTSRVGEATILRLTVEDGVSLEGRVLDPNGRPMAGAYVHIRSARRNSPHGPIVGSELVAFESGSILVADAEGRFRTPPGLDADAEYAAYASAPGYRSSRTYWTRGGVKVFTGLVLRPETDK
jgi:RNA polymerase sigma factor (sigma-70 family)